MKKKGRKKLGINILKKAARKNGGILLSEKYDLLVSHYRWKCRKGHTWTAQGNSIRNQKQWCPVCAKEKNGRSLVLSLEDINRRISKTGVKCVTAAGKYKSAGQHLDFKCRKGHRFKYYFDQLKNKSDCPKCLADKKKTIQNNEWKEKIEAYVKKNNGKVDLSRFITKNTKLDFSCKKGHKWRVSTLNMLSGQTWCKDCSYEKSASLKRHNISVFKEIATERYGECLSRSGDYKNNQSKLRWRCEDGHEWLARASSVKRGAWCPVCSGSIGEKLARIAMEAIFKRRFPRSYPSWLKSKEGYQLELDGYNEQIGIAFEHQGEQHYTTKSIYIKNDQNLTKRIKVDKYKVKICKRNKVFLIQIPQVHDRIELANLADFIIDKCKEEGIRTHIVKPRNVPYEKAYRGVSYQYLDEARAIAESKKGKLLSDKYTGSEVKLEFKCSRGHAFQSILYNVRKGHWCKQCHLEDYVSWNKKDLKYLQKAADSSGFNLLSSKYVNIKTKYSFECKKCHDVRTTAIDSLIKNKGCASCKILENENLLCFYATCFKGEWIDQGYKGVASKHSFKCFNGHVFKKQFYQIKEGKSWCPKCKKEAF